MKKLIAAAALAIAVLASSPSNAGVVVNCTNCASLIQQVKDSAIWAKSLAVEGATYIETAKTYVKAVENTVALPLDALQQVQNIGYRVNSLGRRTSALLASDAGLMQRINMAKSLGTSIGNFPVSTVRNAQWWGDRAEEQWEDNEELLNIEHERAAINAELLELAASNGDMATGQMQALQAQHQISVAMGKELQAVNSNLTKMMLYQMEEAAKEEAKKAAVQHFMSGMQDVTEGQW